VLKRALTRRIFKALKRAFKTQELRKGLSQPKDFEGLEKGAFTTKIFKALSLTLILAILTDSNSIHHH